MTVDVLVLGRTGSSLLSRNPRAFGWIFLASIPLWWIFEGINHFTQNWHYLGADSYSVPQYILLASWHFSIVIPAVFETAELVGSFNFVGRFRNGPCLNIPRRLMMGVALLGPISLGCLILWPHYFFPFTWLSVLLLLDPINHLGGRPSIIGRLQRGDWRLVVALSLGALICGWFWEMWNFWAFPKWEYDIQYVNFARVFEMPLLGYGGYLPFGLEVFAVYHFMTGLVFSRFPKVMGIGRVMQPASLRI